MIRSRSIPTLLSRATGDGIHSILLIDAAGELLGSYGNPPPPLHQGDNNVSGIPQSENNQWPLDAASIGALISQVAGDYRRMGDELLLLDPQYDSRRQSSNLSGADGTKEGGGQDGESQQAQQDASSAGGESEGDMGVSEASAPKSGKDKNPDTGTNMKSLVIELDYVSCIICVLLHQICWYC